MRFALHWSDEPTLKPLQVLGQRAGAPAGPLSAPLVPSGGGAAHLSAPGAQKHA